MGPLEQVSLRVDECRRPIDLGTLQDGYIYDSDGLGGGRQGHLHSYRSPLPPVREGDYMSDRTTSTAPLNRGGARPGIAHSYDSGSEYRRRDYHDGRAPAYAESSAYDDGMHPGVPIGLIAAMGTPYAKKPIFRSKKFKVICLLLIPISLIIANVILLLPIVRAIAKHALRTSTLHVTSTNLTRLANDSFALTLAGQTTKAGVFPARINFRRPVEVYWINPDNMTEVHLGHFPLAPLGAAAGHAKINQISFFQMDNIPAFGRFAEHLITQESFTWRLKSHGVDAAAFNFVAVNNLYFEKDMTLPGMANFTHVTISDFQLPANDPAGGITQDVVTRLTNPSSFGLETGVLNLSLYYKGMYLGPAYNSRPFNLTPGVNDIPLTGRLVDQSGNQTNLDLLGELFSSYLNGDISMVDAYGQSVQLADGSHVQWLSQAVQALHLRVLFTSPTGPINPIKSITIGTFGLQYDLSGQHSYAPLAASNSTSAAYALPFGFDLNITEVAVTMSLINRGLPIANLTTPYGTSTTFTLNQNAGFESGRIDLSLPPSPMLVGNDEDSHLRFSQFQYDLFNGNGSQFLLSGVTSALATTAIGQTRFDNVKFTVPAGVIGLSQLKTAPTEIISVDVVGGTPDHIVLNIVVGMTNPSNLILDVGDVTFQLFDLHDGSFLGTALLPDLHMTVGYQEHMSTGFFQANNNPTALNTLTKFTMGQDSQLAIAGFNGSTNQDSLTQTFMDVQLNTTLHGLGVHLINYANLSLSSDVGRTTNVADSVVSLNNPFTSPLVITNIQANATSRGLYVGAINQNTQFNALGKAATVSPGMGFGLNLFPPVVFSLLRQLVVDSGMDPTPLDGIVQLGGYQYMPTTPGPGHPSKRAEGADGPRFDLYERTSEEGRLPPPDLTELLLEPVFKGQVDAASFADGPRHLDRRQNADLYRGFELPPYVLQAFRALTVDVELVSEVHIGDFVTDLTYSQMDVPAYTDSTLLLLLPVLAAPIVQKIVDQSVLAIESVLIHDPSQTSFGTHLTGGITQAGPFDAAISFPSGMSVWWNGASLGSIAMPDIALAADVGATLDLEATVTVADVGHLTDFTRYLLTEPAFTWTIEGTDLTVSALGINVTGISISKQVVLSGMNGLKNGVTITHVDLPSNDPAGGITLLVDTIVVNPASVGVQLSSLAFNTFFGETNIGPAAITSPFTLAPKSTVTLPLVGRLVPQPTQQGLDDVSAIFNGFIHGIPSTVVVNGDSAGPADVTWLNDGIKALRTPTIFPAAANLKIINSITINAMTLMFTEGTAWSPDFSTPSAVAAFQLPFAFPVDITQMSAQIGTVDQGQTIAVLNVPASQASTDVVSRITTLQIEHVPFAVPGNAHQAFSQFLTDTTDDVSKTFGLSGYANTITNTAVGALHVDNIAFTVSTTVAGLQGLNAQQAFVTDLDVYHGYPDYLQINTNAHLFNPSNITIGTGDVALDLIFQDQQIGNAFIPNLVLTPGENIVANQVRYAPHGDAQTAAGRVMLQNFIQSVTSIPTITGGQDTTPIESLRQALASITLHTAIPPLMQNLVRRASLRFPANILQTGIADTNFDLANPFTASLNLLSVHANAIYPDLDLLLGRINVNNLSPPISAPGHSQITSYFIPLEFNLDPHILIPFIEAQAAKNGVDLGPLPGLFNIVMGMSSAAIAAIPIKSTPLPNSGPGGSPPGCSSGQQFDVYGAILRSLVNIDVTLQIDSVVKIDDYQTELAFNQFNVPAFTDATALNLIGSVAVPVLQGIVDASVLSVSDASITDITDSGFTAALQGSLVNTGPFDALISFPNGLDVVFMGNTIARIDLPALCAPGNVGQPALQTTSQLTITNLDGFTQFSTYILHNPSFEWLLQTTSLHVEAIGTAFDGVTLRKTITLQAFNNLLGCRLTSFDLPGDAPGGAGIELTGAVAIPSPASLGLQLGAATFSTSFMGNTVGPVTTDNLSLLPKATTTAPLTGLIQPQSGDGIRTTGILFSTFLAGVDQTLQATGVSVTSPAQPDHPVNWLSASFKTLVIDVVLPGHVYTIISSIAIANIQIEIINPGQTWAVDASSTSTTATYANPFHFGLAARQVSVNSIITFGGVDAAQLNLPLITVNAAAVSTGQPVQLDLSFHNQTLLALDHGAFASFFAQQTDTNQASFVLRGTANVIAGTSIGNIPISGIPFNVPSTMPGINSFGHNATIPGIPVTVGSGGGGVNSFTEDGGSDFVRVTLNVILNNPSTTSITTNQVSFQVLYQGVYVGRATIPNTVIVPGQNTIASEFHYAPNDRSQSALLTEFLQRPLYGSSDLIPITVQGDAQSSPYGSLVPALEGVSLNAAFQGQGAQLVNFVHIRIELNDLFCKSEAAMQFKVNNSLDAPIQLNALSALADQPRGTNYASLPETTLPSPLAVGPNTVSDLSPIISGVKLTQTIVQEGGLLLAPTKVLALTTTVDTNVGQDGGYNIPSLKYNQDGVPYDYDVLIGTTSILDPLGGMSGGGSAIVLLLARLVTSATCSSDGHVHFPVSCADLVAQNPPIAAICNLLTPILAPTVCTVTANVGNIVSGGSTITQPASVSSADCTGASTVTVTSGATSTDTGTSSASSSTPTSGAASTSSTDGSSPTSSNGSPAASPSNTGGNSPPAATTSPTAAAPGTTASPSTGGGGGGGGGGSTSPTAAPQQNTAASSTAASPSARVRRGSGL